MKTASIWPMPTWLPDLHATTPDIEQEKARTRFLLCLATLYYEDGATTESLSKALGLHPNRLAVMKSRGEQIPATLAVALERMLGRELFPRELFRPDIFVLPE